MAAQTAERRIREERWNYRTYTLAAGKKAWKGGVAVYDESAAACIPGEAQTDLFVLGFFAETVDATGVAKPVAVQLKKEIVVRWLKNDGTNPVLATDIGKDVYVVDDQTVSILATARSAIGKAWAIDSALGVAVEVV
jgi:hypothetical protein